LVAHCFARSVVAPWPRLLAHVPLAPKAGVAERLQQIEVDVAQGHLVLPQPDAEPLHASREVLPAEQRTRRCVVRRRFLATSRRYARGRDQPCARGSAVVMHGAAHLHDGIALDVAARAQHDDREPGLLRPAAQGPGEMQLTPGAPRTPHRTQGGQPFGVEPGRDELGEAGRGQIVESADERTAHLIALLLGGVLDVLLAAHDVAREQPLGQADALVDQTKARPRVAALSARCVRTQRGCDGGRERVGRAAEPPAADQLIGHAREACRSAIAAREHAVRSIRQVLAQ
jgi:hypothetical protein